MKKSLYFLLQFVLIAALFTGCITKSIISKKPRLDCPYSCGFEITAFDGDMCVSGEMSRYGTGIWEMNITSPETMKDMTVKYNEGNTTLSLGELSLEIDAEKLSGNAVFKRIFDAFDSCTAIELTDSSCTYDSEDFTLSFDEENLLPTLLEFSDGISVEISEFTYPAE